MYFRTVSRQLQMESTEATYRPRHHHHDDNPRGRESKLAWGRARGSCSPTLILVPDSLWRFHDQSNPPGDRFWIGMSVSYTVQSSFSHTFAPLHAPAMRGALPGIFPSPVSSQGVRFLDGLCALPVVSVSSSTSCPYATTSHCLRNLLFSFPH